MTYSNSFHAAGGYFQIKLYEEYIIFQPVQGNNPKFSTYEPGAVYTRDGQEVYFTIKDSNQKFLTPDIRNQLSKVFKNHVSNFTPADFRKLALDELESKIASAERSRSYQETEIRKLNETLVYKKLDDTHKSALERESSIQLAAAQQ
jgi:hypothetical protein